MHIRYLPELIFWISWGLLFYTFPGYGVIIAALARWRPAAPLRADFPTPSVCVVVVACTPKSKSPTACATCSPRDFRRKN